MDGQRVPDLEEMDEQQVERFLTELASALSPEEEYRIRHPEDYVMKIPQSGERYRGRENMRAIQEAFPDHSTRPSIRIRRVLVRDGTWVVESVIDYGVAILDLKDGKVWRDRRYFAEPFEAPGWCAHLVERMET